MGNGRDRWLASSGGQEFREQFSNRAASRDYAFRFHALDGDFYDEGYVSDVNNARLDYHARLVVNRFVDSHRLSELADIIVLGLSKKSEFREAFLQELRGKVLSLENCSAPIEVFEEVARWLIAAIYNKCPGSAAVTREERLWLASILSALALLLYSILLANLDYREQTRNEHVPCAMHVPVLLRHSIAPRAPQLYPASGSHNWAELMRGYTTAA
jgi:hypothetical protein